MGRDMFKLEQKCLNLCGGYRAGTEPVSQAGGNGPPLIVKKRWSIVFSNSGVVNKKLVNSH
jgi:hypothetical protein